MLLLLIFNLLFIQHIICEDPWKIDVFKSRDKIDVGEEVKVDIFCSYPTTFEPEVFNFLLNQKGTRKLGYFDFLGGKWNIEKKNNNSILHLQIQLKGEGKGTLIYTPGTLTFSSDKANHTILLPAVEVISKPTHLGVVELAPLLPLNPDLAISMNKENYLLSYKNEERLEKERNRNITVFHQRTVAWSTTFLIFAVIGLIIVVSLIVVEFGLMKRKAPPPKKRYFAGELKELSKASIPLNIRWQNLGVFVRDALSSYLGRELQGKTSQELIAIVSENSLFSNKEFFINFLKRIDLIEFANEKTTQEEFRETCQTLNKWIEITPNL